MKGKNILFVSMLAIVTFGFSDNFIINCKTEKKMTGINITSSAFTDSEMIPQKYTCDSVNVSPPISWTKGPDSTRSYVLICDDPDAPSKVWVHWVFFNISPAVLELPENLPKDKSGLTGATQGMNDSGSLGYSGPCPPSGTHNYNFKVYALDCMLNMDSTATKADVVKAMKDHVLAEGLLIGKYKRNR